MFHEVQFPSGIAYGSEFGPGFSTGMAVNQGGHRFTNRNWSMPLYEGDVIHGVKTEAQYNQLRAFFLSVGGMADGFRFEDFSDYTVTAGVDGIVVQTSPNSWQMYKQYTFGAMTATRKITKPKETGIVIVGSGTYSYESTTGEIEDNTSPGTSPTGWTGQFDTPVMFMTDKMPLRWVAFKKMDWGSIPIKEIRI